MATRLSWLAVIVLLAAGCSGSTSGPGGKAGGGKPKIGVVTNTTDPFWDLCEAGANKAAKDFDVDLTFRQPEKLDAAIQMPIIEAWVKQGMDGIAVSVIDPKGQEEDLTRIGKKVPFLAMDNDAPEATGRLCYIGVDNHEAGRAAGKMVKKALPNGGTIALFIGNNSSANAIGRIGGVLDELSTPEAKGTPGNHPTKAGITGKFYGKYFLIDGEAKTDGGPGEKAVTNARDVLGRLEGVADVCMVGLYAYNPPAILEAARAKSLVGKIKVVGFDENLETLKAIDKGEIEGTVWQDPFNYGYKSVEVLAAVARGDKSKIPGKGQIPYRIVTKDGGPDQTVDGLIIKNLKAVDVEKKIRDDLASVKK